MANNNRNHDNRDYNAPQPSGLPPTKAPNLRPEINLTSAIIAAAEARAARTPSQAALPSHLIYGPSSFSAVHHQMAPAVPVAPPYGFGLAMPFQSPYPHAQLGPQQMNVAPDRRQANLGPPPGYFQPPDGTAYDARSGATNRRVISDGPIHPQPSQGRGMWQADLPHWGPTTAIVIAHIVDHSRLASLPTLIRAPETTEQKAERERAEYVNRARKKYDRGRAFEDDEEFYPGNSGNSGKKT
ncbi:uncharacterized protein PG998_013174 [Apiospora kogelbergensis]|uniref:uncharacterized protein n=1 Tax=Apiospora kogelbergensis TaxID=1337665 RepID=UPI00312D0518